jgi:hypothetical protein
MTAIVLGALKFITSPHMTEQVEDWSRVRSPSRARRRQRQGHRQNVVMRQVPRKEAISIDGGSTFIVHPVVADQIAREMRQKVDNAVQTAMAYGLDPEAAAAAVIFPQWLRYT